MAKSASKTAKKPVKSVKKAAPAKSAKPAPKKVAKAPEKKASKTAAAQSKKTAAKPAKKVEEKKKSVAAKPSKGDSKVAAKAVKEVKKAAKAEKPTKPVKGTEKLAAKAEKPAATKAKTPAPPEKGAEKASAKKTSATAKGKSSKTVKKDEDDMEDVFLDDDMGDSEITEYEEELAIVEEIDEADESSEEELVVEQKDRESEEIYLTDAEGRRYCRARDCDQAAIVDAYCRYHYLLFWRKIQNRKKILMDGKLERYIEELTARYPDKFLEMIRRDLRTEKDFLAAIQELELDESAGENEFEEDTSAFIEEVRGMGEPTGVEDDEF